jgi:hypothetical protein
LDNRLVAQDGTSLAGPSTLFALSKRLSLLTRWTAIARSPGSLGVQSSQVESPGDKELKEGREIEDNMLPRDALAGFPSSEKEYDGQERATFIHSSLCVTSNISATSKSLVNWGNAVGHALRFAGDEPKERIHDF